MSKIELKKDNSNGGLWLTIDGRQFVSGDPYLYIAPKDRRFDDILKRRSASYTVNGVYGFGGMGYRGPISTRSLIRGLNKFGVSITARGLSKLMK